LFSKYFLFITKCFIAHKSVSWMYAKYFESDKKVDYRPTLKRSTSKHIKVSALRLNSIKFN